MTINNYLIELFTMLSQVKVKKINKFIKLKQDQVVIHSGLSKLLVISPDSIKVAGKIDVLNKIKTLKSNNDSHLDSLKKFRTFINHMKPFIIRLNHLGISYFCRDFQKEITSYQKVLNNTHLKIYEEKSFVKGDRWFFIGNLSYWEVPLFEIVLRENPEKKEDFWRPHFQIDLDLNWDRFAIQKLATQTFGKGFIKASNLYYSFGLLEIIDGIKVFLAVSNPQRVTEFHRKKLLGEVKSHL